MLRIYSTDIYFFVMANLFYSNTKLTIHEKYDIKGSTVNRSSAPPSEGQTCTCRHCEQKFTYHRKQRRNRYSAVTPSTESRFTYMLYNQQKKILQNFNGPHDSHSDIEVETTTTVSRARR
jgi:hypothetical protein